MSIREEKELAGSFHSWTGWIEGESFIYLLFFLFKMQAFVEGRSKRCNTKANLQLAVD